MGFHKRDNIIKSINYLSIDFIIRDTFAFAAPVSESLGSRDCRKTDCFGKYASDTQYDFNSIFIMW